ncbi:MAG: AccI family restriction endonuclease [Elusimicrobiaceae bacterium]|nr:AccI family restriction endonuclease [Elusimicrobiaceae bacterium]
MHLFEQQLIVPVENIELECGGMAQLPWAEFLLNPRRLRGSDFLMRWSQGVWSEQRLTEALNSSGDFFAIPYGPSGTAPHNNVREFELYFERLEAAGLGNIKRPDLLVFKKEQTEKVRVFLERTGGVAELPFTREENLRELLALAIIGVECENSLWKASKMPDFNTEFTAQRRLGGKHGLKKTAILPTIIIKDEDMSPLKNWQTNNNLPIHIWHVFYDRAYGISFSEAERLIAGGFILPTVQVFQAPGGATTRKSIYKIYHRYGYPLGISAREPQLLPAFVEDRNGHILPYVKFDGGQLEISEKCLDILRSIT